MRLIERARQWLQTSTGRKAWRYSMVSVVNVTLGQSVVAITFGLLHWSARAANLAAVAVATGPAYLLNRMWVWGRNGRSHLVKEVLPFWVLALTGLGLSTWLAGVGESVAEDVSDLRLIQTGVVMAFIMAAFGVVWVARFLVLDHLVFAPKAVPAVPREVPDAAA